MENRSLLDIVKYLVLFVLLGIIIYEGIMIFNDQREYAVSVNEYEKIEDTYVKPEKDTEDKGDIFDTAPASDDYPHLDINFEELKKINPDFIGWVYFPACKISYPIVKENDIDQYLYRTFEGVNNKAGCIFMDVLSNSDFSGYSDMIFGHNMRNGTMFGNLKTLYKKGNENLLTEHPYVYIYTENKVYRYEVFAYYNTMYSSKTYDEVLSTEDYDKYISYIKANNIFDYKGTADFTSHESLLTLSTCSGAHGSGRRFVVHTLRVKSWNQDK